GCYRDAEWSNCSRTAGRALSISWVSRNPTFRMGGNDGSRKFGRLLVWQKRVVAVGLLSTSDRVSRQCPTVRRVRVAMASMKWLAILRGNSECSPVGDAMRYTRLHCFRDSATTGDRRAVGELHPQPNTVLSRSHCSKRYVIKRRCR